MAGRFPFVGDEEIKQRSPLYLSLRQYNGSRVYSFVVFTVLDLHRR